MRGQVLRAALGAGIFASVLAAQEHIPHAGYIYPAGARRASSIEVRVGGQYLNGADRVFISGRGVRARVVGYDKPLNGAEVQKLREELKQLQEKRAASLAPASDDSSTVEFDGTDRRRIAALRSMLNERERRLTIPALAEIATLRVEIAPDAALGPRNLRLETAGGLTNPVFLRVGELPEYARPPGQTPPARSAAHGTRAAARTAPQPREPPMFVSLPALVNGQVLPGETHRFRFHAARGQHLVIAADGRELIPYVADAVPGWFQAVLTLRDAQDRELASADHYRFHPDPLLHYEIAADGDYIAEIRDSLYRGREDFVYRLSIGEFPVITDIYPLGGKQGRRATIEIHGYNLPVTHIGEDFKRAGPGVQPVSLRKNGWTSNEVAFALDSLPETAAKAASGAGDQAQRVKLPTIINGRISAPGEVHIFRIDGRAGEELAAEVLARRLGSPLDSTLRLTDAAGKELAFNDDYEDLGAGLLTHQADSFLSVTLPATGAYYLQLADAQGKGGAEYAYRLRVSHPRPDFELRVAPASFNVRAGATEPFTVYALRHDGFDGPIELSLRGAPADCVLSGPTIPAGVNKVRVTLTASRRPAAGPLPIQLIGRAAIGGRDVTHAARPADEMEQAFAYRHLVSRDAWLLSLIGRAPQGLPFSPYAKLVKLPADADTPLSLFIPTGARTALRLALNEPPEGVSLERMTQEGEVVQLVLRVRAGAAKPGLKGNLILDAFREVPPKDPESTKPGRSVPIGTVPAIPFEVVAAVQKN